MKTKKTILLTGLTGFIGRNVAKRICKDFDVTALVRPKTDKSRYDEFKAVVNIVELSLSDSDALRAYLNENCFDFILHIGALRGGRKFDREEYLKANVVATQILVNSAIKNNSKFIFCSSVGVYGAIPAELPATLKTPFKEDSLYHKTKIRCEEMIQKAVSEKGLRAYIVRPAITYGVGDYGFPFTLTKLVAKKILFLPRERIFIHLTNVELLADVFAQLLDKEFESGKVWNVADRDKVCFQVLADYIHKRIHSSQPYPKNKYINKTTFALFTKIAKLLKNELWTARFELISNSWYFDVESTYLDFQLKDYKTIPEFDVVIDWYSK